MKVKITTDSTCDQTKEYLEGIGLPYLPCLVTLGDQDYTDTVDITTADIEKYVKKTKKLPKSAARSSVDFKEFFTKELKGVDAIVHISISSELSCLYNNAVKASEEIGGNKVYVVNSRVLSTGTLLLAQYAMELAQKGEDAKTIAEKCGHRAYAIQTSFVVDTIDYLYKGGRCSMMAAFGANLLKLKPKLQLVDGKVISTAKYRGKAGVVLKKYVDDTLALYNNPDKKRCYVTHADADPEIVDEIVEYLKSKNIFEEVIPTHANCTIYSHCGKGTLGILYINDGGMD